MVIFHCYVSSPEGRLSSFPWSPASHLLDTSYFHVPSTSPRLRAARVVDHLGHSQAAPSGDSAVAVAERALAAAGDQKTYGNMGTIRVSQSL